MCVENRILLTETDEHFLDNEYLPDVEDFNDNAFNMAGQQRFDTRFNIARNLT